MAKRFRVPLIQQGIIQPNDAEKKAGVGQPTPQQIQQQKMAQMNEQLLKGKADKMTADAGIAQSRLQSSPGEQEKLKLGNMKLASEIHDAALGHAGIPDMQQARTDQLTNAQELSHQGNLNQQELRHNEETHRQGLTHEHQAHTAGVLKERSEHEHGVGMERHDHDHEERRAHEKHQREEARKHEAHQSEMTRMREKHALELEHATKLNDAKVAAAKAMAKAKPKAAAKKAA